MELNLQNVLPGRSAEGFRIHSTSSQEINDLVLKISGIDQHADISLVPVL